VSRPPEPLPDAELQAEREMLEYARRCLAAMRRRTRSLRAAGADPYAVESVEWRLRQRVAALTDDGRTGLFFGRLDYDAGADPPEARFYIGRRHVSDAEGDPVVIDWRAGLAHPFYRASPARRYGVRVRRRFGYRGGTLTSILDEVLDLLDEAAALAVADRVLVAEIERPRIGPMRDIVATIQPEQDDLIRAPLAETICVQGGPGTGKTAVGLHRAAFLLYEHRERLARDGVLVVGPGPAYLAFIRDVLPGLGEVGVAQRSVEDLVAEVAVTGSDRPEAAAVKADARMAAVVRRAAFLHVRQPALPLEVRFRHRVVRVPADALRGRVDELVGGDLRYQVGRDHLRDWLVERCLRHLEHTEGLSALDSPAEVQRSLAARPEVRAFLRRTWPVVDPVRLVFRLLTERSFLAEAADGILSGEEQELLGWAERRGAGAAGLGRAAAEPQGGAVVGDRRVPGRRGRRRGRGDAHLRACRGRRGPGPVRDAAAGDRTALPLRVGHAARRPGPADHAVVGRPLGGRPRPPGPPLDPDRAPAAGVPGAQGGA
jgi:hypothetical protein